MINIEKILENIQNKKIYIDDLLQMEITDNEYDLLLTELSKKDIQLVRSEELKSSDNNVYLPDSYKQYINEISKIPLLTKEEEIALARAASKGSASAKKQLCESNLRLVVSVAKKNNNTKMDLLDLIQFGNMGLMKAIEKYDVTKGYRFSTYAYWWIVHAIKRGICDQSRLVRITCNSNAIINKIRNFQAEYMEKQGFYPSVEKISEKLNMPVNKIQSILYFDNAPISIYQTLGEDNDCCLSEVIPSEENIEEQAIQNIKKQEINYIMQQCLSPREIIVIKLRYGFDDDSPKTLSEIGEKFKVSRERIRQVEVKALTKLKHYYEYQNRMFEYKKTKNK